MSTWIKQKLGDVVDINKSSLKKDFQYQEIEYIDISSVGTGKLESFSRMFISDSPSRAKRLVHDGDTILATVRPNRRSFLYIKSPPKNRIVSTGFAVLSPHNIDSRFLYYVISQQEFTEYLTKNAKGAAYPAVDEGIISRADVLLPDLPTQSRIASVLSSYDDLIENNEKRIKILEEMAQRLYTEWFVRFNFPRHKEVKMIDSLIGKIPEGWKVMPLNQAILVNPTTKLTSRENVLHIPMESLSNTLSVIDINKTFRNDKISGPRFINEDTLFSRITPCLQNGKTGYINILKDGEVACGSTEFVVFRPNVLTSIYIYLLSRTNDFRETAILTMVGASGRQRVRSEFFQSYQVLVPSKDLLNTFESKVSSNFSVIKNLHYVNDRLRKIRDLLIPELIPGRRKLKN